MIPSADFDSNLQGKQPRTSAYVPSNLNPNSLDLSEVLNLSQYHVSKHALNKKEHPNFYQDRNNESRKLT